MGKLGLGSVSVSQRPCMHRLNWLRWKAIQDPLDWFFSSSIPDTTITIAFTTATTSCTMHHIPYAIASPKVLHSYTISCLPSYQQTD